MTGMKRYKYTKYQINSPKSVQTSNSKVISKNKCGLCGKRKNLIKTPCCGQWICDDEDQYRMFSYADNSCSRNHSRYTLCGSHHAEGHKGDWKTCSKCREGIETEMYVWYGTNNYNFEKLPNPPHFEPKHCSKCGRLLNLGEEGFSVLGSDYTCEKCTQFL